MWVFTLATLAIVCPPSAVELAERKEGETCGGFCDSHGYCAKNLECVKQKPARLAFSFLSPGTPSAVGRCERSKSADEPKAKLTVEGFSKEGPKTVGGKTVGGVRSLNPEESPELLPISEFAMGEIRKASASNAPLSVTKIISATSQVIAGTKYVLVLQLSDGSRHSVQVPQIPLIPSHPQPSSLSHTSTHPTTP